MNKAWKGAIALCFATLLTTLSAGAQRSSGTNEADRVSEPLLAAIGKQQAGEYNAARGILLEALSRTSDSAVLLNALGSVEQDLAEYLEAERSYLRALSASTQTERNAERVIVLQNLATLYLDTHQYSKGERVREQLEKFQTGALDDNPAKAGVLLTTLAGLEHARKRDDLAERYYSQSLMLFQQAYGPVSVNAALVQSSLGFLRLEARQYESAAALFRKAIHEIEIASSPENQALIRPLINLAGCESMAGHANEAEAVARRAVELSVKVFGEKHPVTATAMLIQATALRRLRRKGLARKLEKRANACLRNNSTTNLAGYTVSLRDLAGATPR